MIYEPREDSFLLQKEVSKYAFGEVLDIGAGSGIQAATAAKKKNVKSVLAIDIQKKVIDYCKKNIKNKKIKFSQSDLFSNVKEKFDTVIFNPPYLPEDVRLKDITLDGGKKGYEIIERFLNNANDYLKENGIILLLFSSLTNKEKINEILQNNLLEFEEISKQKIFFEELHVYLIKKSGFLKILSKKNIKNIKKLAKGHRGLIFTGNLGKKKVAIKIQRKDIEAKNTVDNEARQLKTLNKHDIGPKILFSGKDYFVYEFIPGEFIIDFFKKSNKKDILNILKNVFDQMFIMDKLKLNKEEMHHPLKHIIIGKNKGKNKKPSLVDFERCKPGKNPRNVTQFCQFAVSTKLKKEIFDKKGIKINREKMLNSAKTYKHEQTKKNLEKIKALLR